MHTGYLILFEVTTDCGRLKQCTYNVHTMYIQRTHNVTPRRIHAILLTPRLSQQPDTISLEESPCRQQQ